ETRGAVHLTAPARQAGDSWGFRGSRHALGDSRGPARPRSWSGSESAARARGAEWSPVVGSVGLALFRRYPFSRHGLGSRLPVSVCGNVGNIGNLVARRRSDPSSRPRLSQGRRTPRRHRSGVGWSETGAASRGGSFPSFTSRSSISVIVGTWAAASAGS